MRTRDENKEAAIREKAIEMVVKEGFDGLSMQKLAKAAGVSPATIYIYYKDREDLLMQISVDENKKMAEATLKNFNPDMTFEEGLRIQWLNRAHYCLENPLRMHFLEQIRYSPMHEKVFRKDTQFADAMRQFVMNAIKQKQLIQLPVEVYWSVAFAPLYQLVKFHMVTRPFPGREKFVLDEKIMNQTLKLVLKALKP
jgi:TetR/AcrR family transcriptional repressor of multidrug resistance operon